MKIPAMLLTLPFMLLLGSCTSDCKCEDASPSTLDPLVPPITEGAWAKPSMGMDWNWQLQGTLDTTIEAEVYDVDLEYTDAAMIQSLKQRGRFVVCYFSAGSWENFRDDAKDIPEEQLGDELDGWPEERWWNIQSVDVQELIRKRLDLAQAKGCDGVEPDNVDAYQNDNGLGLDSLDQLSFNRWLANEAHLRGLAVGLKNDLGHIPELVDYFDFAVNEQCYEYEECDTYEPFIAKQKPVFNAEYRQVWVTNEEARDALCNSARLDQLQTLILPLELDGSFRFSCQE